MQTIVLHDVTGIGRRGGTDQNGCEWLEQFYGEMQDSAVDMLYECDECPNCGHDITDMYDRYECANCREVMYLHLMPTCVRCGRHIGIVDSEAWLCLDDGDIACTTCVTVE